MNLRSTLLAFCLASGFLAFQTTQSEQAKATTTCTPAPSGDLRGCNLSGKDLRNANLSHANLGTRYIPKVTAIPAKWLRKKYTGYLSYSETYNIAGSCGDVSWDSGSMIGRALCYNSMVTTENKYGEMLCKAPYSPTDSIFNGDDERSVFSSITVTCSRKISSGRPAQAAQYINSSLSNANLSGANLSGANLSEVDLSGANLSGTNLGGANLSDVVSGKVTGTPSALPKYWKLIHGYLIGPKANLTGAHLSGMNLKGMNLSATNLGNAQLHGVISGGIIGKTKALPANWKLVQGYLIGPGANLSGANLEGADLSAINLRGAILSGAILKDANLSGIKSGRIIGQPSSLPKSFSLKNGYLIGHGADLHNADFSSSDLSGVNLELCDLSGATLKNVQSGNVSGMPNALPNGWILRNGYLVGPAANLSGASLEGVNLQGANLTGINFRAANLTSANLTESNLANANLSETNLSETNLTGTVLTGVSSGGIIGTPLPLPEGWSITSGYLIGPGVNLTGANLTGINLTGINLTGANLTDATLTNANLTGAHLSRANLSGVRSGNLTGTHASLPVLWVIINGYLIGEGANLAGANLAGANLVRLWRGGDPIAGSGPVLLGVNLHGANLSGANLSGQDLKEANLSGANLTGANFTNSDFYGVNLRGANITGANITGCQLELAGLDRVISNKVQGTPLSLPEGWILLNGVLKSEI